MPPHLSSYFAKVDARLRGVSRATAREMLATEINRWVARYEDFQRRLATERGFDPGTVTAFDYIETIGGLGERKARLA